MDLFRYDQNGARSFSTSASATAYFSINGTTDLVQFNQHAGGDFSDFFSYPNGGNPPRVQDAYATQGATPNLGIEFTALDVMGYHLVPLAGDANGDGIVNSQDLALVSSAWLYQGSSPADVNNDGVVNAQDLALISSNWLGTYGSAGTGGSAADATSNGSSVPEPSTWLLAAVGACAVFLRGWRQRARRLLHRV